MPEVQVWKCSIHGEMELIDHKEPVAYCPYCGKEMTKVGEYSE